jgi:hypothetical protein
MATKHTIAKRARSSSRNHTTRSRRQPEPPPLIPYDPGVSDAAVATLVRSLLIALRQSLAFSYVAASALRRRKFELGRNVASDLAKALDGKLDMDLQELQRLLTYVSADPPRPRDH